MANDVRARPWPAIVAGFYELAARGRPVAPVADLAARIAESRYAEALHATIDGEVLLIAQTDPFDPQREVLQLARVGDEIVFDFVESVFEPRRWRARVAPDEAFATFERFLHEKRWFSATPR